MQRLVTNLAVAWLACACVAPANADDAVIPAGRFVYCTVCHGAQMRGNVKLKAPRVSGMEGWYVNRQLDAFKAGWRGKHGEDVSGMEMRPMAAILSDEDIAEVSDYVNRVSSPLPPASVDGDVTRGANLYTSCSACHGANGEGNEALGAPGLAGRSDWYLVTQLQNYRAGIRGGNPADVYGNQMRAAMSTLSGDDAIDDVVAYLNTLKPE